MQVNRVFALILLLLVTRFVPCRLIGKGSSKNVLTLQRNRSPIFTGETVSLTCSGKPLRGYGFIWERKETVTFVNKYTSYKNTYTISPVTAAHSGEYRCSGSDTSDVVHLIVSALPKANLTVEPKWRPLYTGETITLKCGVYPGSDWTYFWYKDQLQLAVSQTAGVRVTGDRYTITADAGSDQGQYGCEGKLERRGVTSQHSDPITLSVKALPKATLTVEPKWRPLYTGETITLKCGVDPGSDWKYFWFKGQLQSAVSQTARVRVTGERYTITAAAGSDQGQYWCEGKLKGRNVTSQHSDPITLTVTALPKAILTVEPKWRPLHTGETITLKCGVDFNSNWTYIWYTDEQNATTPLAQEYRVNITAAAGSDQGQYWCEGRLQGRNVTSQSSDPITLTVTGPLMILPIIIGVGFFLLVLALILILIFFMKYRRNKEPEGHDDVVYSSLILKNQKKKKNSNEKPGGRDDVVYSSLALMDQKKKEKSNKKARGCDDVVYSSLALKDQKKKKKESHTADVLYSTVNIR